MNVGVLVHFREWGGCEVETVQLAGALQSRGHHVTIVGLDDESAALYRAMSEIDLPIVSKPMSKSIEGMRIRDWLRYFKGEEWDCCILIKGSFKVGTWKLDVAARMAFGDYVTVEQLAAEPVARTSRKHLGVFPGLGLWWRMELLRGILRSLGPKLVICVSDAVRRMLISEYHFPPRKLVRIWNGIDTSRFVPSEGDARAARREWGIAEDALVFGAVGRLAVMKGYDVAIAAFQDVLTSFPDRDIHLVLVGQGGQEEALRAQAAGIQPTGRVHFVPFTSTPWRVLPALDVFIMPSLNEGLPLALLEAMACGCAPVATRAGGIPEVLGGGDIGWLVDIGDRGAFAGAMLEAAGTDRAALRAIGTKARQHARDYFDSRDLIAECADVVERLVEGPALPRDGWIRSDAGSPAGTTGA